MEVKRQVMFGGYGWESFPTVVVKGEKKREGVAKKDSGTISVPATKRRGLVPRKCKLH
jgi:hypothetical protein